MNTPYLYWTQDNFYSRSGAGVQRSMAFGEMSHPPIHPYQLLLIQRFLGRII